MLILANVLALTLIAADEPKPAPVTAPSGAVEAQEVWQLTLPEAIRIGLENSSVVRVITLGAEGTPPGGFEPTPLNPKTKEARANRAQLVVARLNPDASLWNFKSAMMAHIRSIEQQYWVLSMLQVNLWARETAVKLGEEIVKRERAELNVGGRNQLADIAEAEQQLENFKLNLVSATSDLITTERQLRNILGLPASDNRRIVASTAPGEDERPLDWDECLAQMLTAQPDLAEQRARLNSARLKALIEVDNPTLPAETRAASQRELDKQQELWRQLTQQTTHSLARFFLEIDANYKQFKTAARLREAAQHRLDAQRAFYEEGRITVDRLLDAVSQYANAIAQESQYKSSYNTSIAAFEEARGTILSYEGVAIASQVAKSKSRPTSQDDRVAPAAFQQPPVAAGHTQFQTLRPAPIAPAPTAFAGPVPASVPPPAAGGTTYKLRAKLGLLKVLDVELEVSPSPK